MRSTYFGAVVIVYALLSGCSDQPESDSDASIPAQAESDGKTATAPVTDAAQKPETKPPQAPAKPAEIPLSEILDSQTSSVPHLAEFVTDTRHKAMQRLAALQKVTKLDQQRGLALCAKVARNPGCKDARKTRLLRNNALAILVRAEHAARESGSARQQEQIKSVLDELCQTLELKNTIQKLREHQ